MAKEQKKSRILNTKDWLEKRDELSNTAILRKKRHANIVSIANSENIDIPLEYSVAEKEAKNRVVKKMSISQDFINSLNNNSATSSIKAISQEIATNAQAIQLTNVGISAEDALKQARENYQKATYNNKLNSFYEQSTAIANGINGLVGGRWINPYESQMLFEFTSLGHRGVMIPIEEAFSTTLNVLSNLLDGYDIKSIYNYMLKHNVVKTIRTASIDASVYGGGIVSPIMNLNKEPIMLSDLKGDLLDYFGVKKLKLEAFMTFDRFCVVPEMTNDGMYLSRLMSDAPIPLRTIFGTDNGAGNGEMLNNQWYAKFSANADSRTKLVRPDGFGMGVFAYASKAIYNYEQQIQFLNYALNQLSIVVFSAKSQSYEEGGSGDTSWNSAFGGLQMQDIGAQLSSMQNAMGNTRGIFLNDIEVKTLNRTFAGIDSIIGAMDNQAAQAFGLSKEQLFGTQKSGGFGNEVRKTTPLQMRLREQHRGAIVKILQWVVFFYFAENNFMRSFKGGKFFEKWNIDEFEKMLSSLDVVYSDSIQTQQDILKESGIDLIFKMVEGRLLPIEVAINHIANIPILSKSFNDEEDLQRFIEKAKRLQEVGIEASIQEQTAITAVNKAIEDLKDKNTKREEVEVGEDGTILKDLDITSFGNVQDNGFIYPAGTKTRDTAIEPTQAELKKRTHE